MASGRFVPYSRSVRKDGGIPRKRCCIESGDDLNPDRRGLAFGRVAGVGNGGRLTGFIFSFRYFRALDARGEEGLFP